MTWTYSGNPASSNADTVRFLIGDTDSTDPLAQDEEIAFALAQRGSHYGAAAMICRAIAARFARLADQSVDAIHTSHSQMNRAFLSQAAQLEQLDMTRATPYAGGLSRSGKLSVEQDEDRRQPAFRTGQDDNQVAIDDSEEG
ncbi:MAG: hypothetical protein ABT940_09105 [Alphaproteobacteria bacterium]